MVQAGHNPSGNNEWETPKEIFDHWNKIFHFDLDVCAEHSTTKVDRYYTRDGMFKIHRGEPGDVPFKFKIHPTHGLLGPWGVANWCNPPYGKGLIKPWLEKAKELSKYAVITVALIPATPAVKWWQNNVENTKTGIKHADYIYFYPKRIDFLKDGKVVKGNNQGNAIVIWGLKP